MVVDGVKLLVQMEKRIIEGKDIDDLIPDAAKNITKAEN